MFGLVVMEGMTLSGHLSKFLAHSALPPTHTRPLTLTAHGEQSQNWTEKKQEELRNVL
jgi:hypothetical protein